MTHKRTRKRPNWRVEECGTGNPCETALIVIHPRADIDSVSECCENLYDDTLTRVHILFDNRTPASLVPRYLQIIKTALPALQHTVRFAHPFVIALVGHLWREMQAYGERRGKGKDNFYAN